MATIDDLIMCHLNYASIIQSDLCIIDVPKFQAIMRHTSTCIIIIISEFANSSLICARVIDLLV